MKDSDIKQRLIKTGMSEPQAVQALAFFLDCKKAAKARDKYAWRAPFKMFSVAKKLSWDAEALSDDLNPFYGNNVGINGDRFPWKRMGHVIDKQTREVVKVYDYNDRHEAELSVDRDAFEIDYVGEKQPIPLGDSYVAWSDADLANVEFDAKSLAYWVGKDHHPRSWFARWIWLGFRNRASKYAEDHGPLITRDMLENDYEFFGDDPLTTGRDKPGAFAIRCGTAWQYRSYEKWGPLIICRYFGAKLEDLFKYPSERQDEQRVMAVYTPWAPKGAK